MSSEGEIPRDRILKRKLKELKGEKKEKERNLKSEESKWKYEEKYKVYIL